MGRPRGTFSKRNRETKLKERAQRKAERRAARKSEVRTEKGPPTDINPVERIVPGPADTDTLPAAGIAETE